MNLLFRLGAWLRQEARAIAATLRDRRLAAVLGLLAALLALAACLPLSYTVDIGCADGPGSDLPLVRGFYPPEPTACGEWRWTTDRAIIRFPGVGQRPARLTLGVLGLNDEMARRGPKRLEIWANGRKLGDAPVLVNGGRYHILLPAPPDGSGDQIVEIRSATVIPSGDERSIGVPVTTAILASPGALALPAWRSTLLWLLAALLAWIALRRAGWAARPAQRILLPAVALLGVAAALDPPRTAFGAAPAVAALLLALPLLVALRETAPAAFARLGAPLDARALRWLLLLALLVFGLRFGGKLYPDSMPGDIGFHTNRLTDTVRGTVLLLSRNRGVDFPYPPAFYLLLAPFTLLGIDPPLALRLGGGLLDAVSPLLIYAIAVACRPGQRGSGWPIAAAGIYALSASGFMTTWWNFSTHIFAQFAHLLLIACLIVGWRALERADPRTLLLLVLVQTFVYLGHFGFWINMTLLGGFGLVALGLAAWRGAARRRMLWPLLLAFVAAEAFAALFFYSAYTGLFIEQLRATASGGLTGLAGRGPVPLAVLWATLWDAGLRTHFGFFPVPLALAGFLLALRARPRGPLGAALVLIGGTFLIALFFAVLPFLSGSTLSTRWLMFSAWAIAVAGAWGGRALWRRGLAGRVAVAAAAGYMLWIAAAQWLAALAWRVRPPEPF